MNAYSKFLLRELILNAIVAYFVIYPIIYFGFNFVIESFGFPQYKIPGFWVGMVGMAVIMVTKNTFFSRSK